MRLLIVGYSEAGHMGSYLASAAKQLRLEHRIIDARGAEARGRIVSSFHWRLRGGRPARLESFGAQVLETCAAMRPNVVLTTGCAPLDQPQIASLRRGGIRVINYSTDDPWNPALRAPWFLSVLPAYDAVFSARRANLDDFRRLGVRVVHYLPFGYDPQVHRPWPHDGPMGQASDVLFVGGCDGDRLPLIGALIDGGLQLALFGGYWNRHSKTRPFWRGIVDQDTIRAASAATRVCLCLVRRANRDDNVMRSFEAAAIGGCILAEDTAAHRELFGTENRAARYFKTSREMVEQAQALVADAEARQRMSAELHRRVIMGRNTYADRLRAMLRVIDAGESSHTAVTYV